MVFFDTFANYPVLSFPSKARNGCGILPDYLFCRENKEGEEEWREEGGRKEGSKRVRVQEGEEGERDGGGEGGGGGDKTQGLDHQGVMCMVHCT